MHSSDPKAETPARSAGPPCSSSSSLHPLPHSACRGANAAPASMRGAPSAAIHSYTPVRKHEKAPQSSAEWAPAVPPLWEAEQQLLCLAVCNCASTQRGDLPRKWPEGPQLRWSGSLYVPVVCLAVGLGCRQDAAGMPEGTRIRIPSLAFLNSVCMKSKKHWKEGAGIR